MAAMKPRTGDGPLEVTKEGRGIVMRVPLEGGGRLVVELNGAEVWAFPVLPDADGPLLGPGADEAGDALGVDLLAALEASRATGRTGELTTVPVAGRTTGDAADGASEGPGQVLLVGVGEATTTDLRRAGAALARATKDRGNVVTSLASIAPDEGLGAFVVGAMLGSFG